MIEYWVKFGVKMKYAIDLNEKDSDPKGVGNAEIFVEIEKGDEIVDYPIDEIKDTLSEKELSIMEEFLKSVTKIM